MAANFLSQMLGGFKEGDQAQIHFPKSEERVVGELKKASICAGMCIVAFKQETAVRFNADETGFVAEMTSSYVCSLEHLSITHYEKGYMALRSEGGITVLLVKPGTPGFRRPIVAVKKCDCCKEEGLVGNACVNCGWIIGQDYRTPPVA